MISYEPKQCKILFLLQWRGSVFPKSLAWAIPACIIAVLVSLHFPQHDMGKQGSQVWSGYNFVLGFLIVFRTQSAYSRFWEGATLLQQVRGEWFNAVSSLFAFCSTDAKKSQEVEAFQHLLVRLMSLLYTGALQQVCNIAASEFEVLEHSGIARENLDYLEDKEERCEIILQWIQRLVVDSMSSGVLPIPPPVISRVFQELSRGIVSTNNARKISDVHFPFPYVQMITTMLWIHWLITPVICGVMLPSRYWAGIMCFAVVFAVHSINYIAEEIEMPFGEDLNDLPVTDLMASMNRSLLTLMNPMVQQYPKFDMSTAHLMAPAKLEPDELPTEKPWPWPFSQLSNLHSGGPSKKSQYGIQATVGRGRPSIVAGGRPAPRGRPSLTSFGVVPDELSAKEGMKRSPDTSKPSSEVDESEAKEAASLVEVAVDCHNQPDSQPNLGEISKADETGEPDQASATPPLCCEPGLTSAKRLAEPDLPAAEGPLPHKSDEESLPQTEASTPAFALAREQAAMLPSTEVPPARNPLSRSLESKTSESQQLAAMASTMDRDSSETATMSVLGSRGPTSTAMGLSLADLVARSKPTLPEESGEASKEPQLQQDWPAAAQNCSDGSRQTGRPSPADTMQKQQRSSASTPPPPAISWTARADGEFGKPGSPARLPADLAEPPSNPTVCLPQGPPASEVAGLPAMQASTIADGSPIDMVWPPRPMIPTRLARPGMHLAKVKPTSE